jgi:hypothetical protein
VFGQRVLKIGITVLQLVAPALELRALGGKAGRIARHRLVQHLGQCRVAGGLGTYP